MFDDHKFIGDLDLYDASFLILLTAKAFGFLNHTWLFVLIPLAIKLFMQFGRSWLETAAEDILKARERRKPSPAAEEEKHENTEILQVVTEEMENAYIEQKEADQEE